jgi:O-antigen/teichoic acid export membrane protein
MKISPKITNFLIYGFGQAINLLSPLIIMPYIILTCKEDKFGKIGIAFSITLILNCILDYSSNLIGTKEIVSLRDKQNYLRVKIADIYTYKTTLFISIAIITSLFVLLNPYIEDKLLYLYSLPIILSQLLNPNWLLQGLENFKLIAILNILSKLIYISLIFIFIQQESDYIFVNFYLGISSSFIYLCSVFYLFKKLKIKFRYQNLVNGFNTIKNDYTICFSELCLSIYQYFPIIIIGYFGGDVIAGFYRIIEQIFNIFRTFIFMFFSYSFPTICSEIEKNFKNGFKLWKLYHFVNLCIITIGCVLVFLLNNQILIYFHLPSEHFFYISKLLKLALLIPILIVFSQALRQLMFALELTQAYTKIIYSSSILNMILLCCFTYFFSLEGALISMIVIEFFIITLYYYNIYRAKKMIYEN